MVADKKIFNLPLLWLLIFLLIPNILILLISFSHESSNIVNIFDNSFSKSIFPLKLTLENFINIFSNRIYVKAFITTFKLSFLTTIICLLIGYPYAYYVSQYAKNKQVMIFLVIIPFWTSLLIRVFAWLIFLRKHGFINELLVNLNIINLPIDFTDTLSGTLIVMVYSYLPFMILPIYTILEKINKKYSEAATDLGANELKVLTKIIFPLSLPGVFSGAMLVFIPCIGEFVIPELVGGSNVLTIGKVIWNSFFYAKDLVTSCTITVIIFFIIIPIFILRSFKLEKVNE